MIVLSIDSASISSCCGVMKDGIMLAQGFVNNGLTHSQTLVPLISKTLDEADIRPLDIDLICVTKGPGSFTGLRIGLATVKGLAAPNDIKCVGVSTLEAIAFTAAKNSNGIICAVMDARCKQVYNALFKAENGQLTRLCEDRAISIAQLEDSLLHYDDDIILCGDGARLCFDSFEKISTVLASAELLLPKGFAVCALGEKYISRATTSNLINPVYLRLPQAQRELQLKKKEV